MGNVEMNQARVMRSRVRDKLVDWGLCPNFSRTDSSKTMAELLEYKAPNRECPMGIPEWGTPQVELYEKLKLLDGPNGYAVFRAMQARREHG